MSKNLLVFIFLIGFIFCLLPMLNATPFISIWNTSKTSTGSSNSTTIVLPLESTGTYNFTINWGDGTIENKLTYKTNHTYATAGNYTIQINGTLIGWRFDNKGDRLKITNITQWGDLRLGNSNSYFESCTNLDINASDALNLTGTTDLFYAFSGTGITSVPNINLWDVSKVTNMSSAFENAHYFNGNITFWDTSNVTDMKKMFSAAYIFNQNISNWNTSKVTDMSYMFAGTSFNQNLTSWDTSKVIYMNSMFSSSEFNGNISTWDTSSVIWMSSMFENADHFNQDIGSWNTSSVTNMVYMFYHAHAFNQDIGNWDVSQVTSFENTFSYATVFNQNLTEWNTSSVINMDSVFNSAAAFNGNISTWDTSKVTDMKYAFFDADAFNQNLTNWDTSSVEYMTSMFAYTTAFNGNISTWDTSKVISMQYMFRVTTGFNQDISRWNTSKVSTMNNMFSDARKFNQYIGDWDTSNVTDMVSMFDGALVFNQPLDNWNVSHVQRMDHMFEGALLFNQNLSSWDTSNVTDMHNMFAAADDFNGNISTWNTSKVTDMGDMFFNAHAFNQPIGNWDLSQVTAIEDMFGNAYVFNQDISNWNTSKIFNMAATFSSAQAFNQNLSKWNIGNLSYAQNIFTDTALSIANYDSILIGWASQTPNIKNNTLFNGGALGYTPSASSARSSLISLHNWSITDGGMKIFNVLSPGYYKIFSQDAPTAFFNVSLYADVDVCYWDNGTTNLTMTKFNSTYFYNDTIGDFLGEGFYDFYDESGGTGGFFTCNLSSDGSWVTEVINPFIIDSKNITKCRNLYTANREYLIVNNLTYVSGYTCIGIEDDNITIDGQGHTINFDVTYSDEVSGIAAWDGNNIVIIKNLNLNGLLYYGIDIQSDNVNISNVTIINSYIPLTMYQSRNVTIFNNTFVGNALQFQMSENVYLYNNSINVSLIQYASMDNLNFNSSTIGNFWRDIPIINDVNSNYMRTMEETLSTLKSGYQFKSRVNGTILYIVKDDDCNATKGYILDNAKNVLYTTDFVDNIATFTDADILADDIYYVAADANGDSYYRTYEVFSDGYPQVEKYINYTGGLDDGIDNDTGFNIYSINLNNTEWTGGYSEVCIDADFNGICDNPMDIDTMISCSPGVDCGTYVDYLPMSDEEGGVPDTDAPLLSIINPIATNYIDRTQLLNISVTDDFLDTTIYNYNGTNYTYTTSVNVVFKEGANTLIVWANDTSGNWNSTSVTFNIDSIHPIVSIIYPQDIIYSNIPVDAITYTATDTHLDKCWYSLNNGVTNTSITDCVNLTGLTSVVGANNWTIYANDTYGNVGQDNAWFTRYVGGIGGNNNAPVYVPVSQGTTPYKLVINTNDIWYYNKNNSVSISFYDSDNKLVSPDTINVTIVGLDFETQITKTELSIGRYMYTVGIIANNSPISLPEKDIMIKVQTTKLGNNNEQTIAAKVKGYSFITSLIEGDMIGKSDRMFNIIRALVIGIIVLIAITIIIYLILKGGKNNG